MKRIYFASDAHLGNRYLQDPLAAEKRLVAWLDSIKYDAKAVYFLGDMFDYWYEYKYVVPKGHVRFFGKIAELSDLGVEIHFFTGNHDIWMYGYLQKEINATVHKKPLQIELLGKHFFLAHGDEVGYGTPRYRFIQAVFRCRPIQVLYSAIHPRWSFEFAQGWSLSSRKTGLQAERLAKTQERGKKSLEEFSSTYLKTHPETNYFIYGHLHLLYDQKLTDTARMMIIGDWMTQFSYAVFDGETLELKQITTENAE